MNVVNLESLPEVEAYVGDSLKSLEGTLPPKRVEIREVTDPFGEDAWRVVLILDRPENRTWDREAVFTTRLKAEEIFDRWAAKSGRGLPGATIASVTTDDVREEDIAVDEEDDLVPDKQSEV